MCPQCAIKHKLRVCVLYPQQAPHCVLWKETRQIAVFYVPEYIHKEESYGRHDTLLEHAFLFIN